MTEQQSLEWDADRLMEQLIMQESRHMQMSQKLNHLTLGSNYELVIKVL